MPRFFLEQPPPGDPRGTTVTIEGREAKHALRVLRLQPGAEVALFDGTGIEYTGRVEEARSRGILVRIERQERVEREPPFEVDVAVGIPKGKKMSQLVRGLGELGTRAVRPFVSERAVVRPDPADPEGPSRWRQIAIEASKQCGRSTVLRVEPPETLEAVTAHLPDYDLAILTSLADDAPPLRKAVAAAGITPGEGRPRILALVGPEGDFTPAEMESLLGAGAKPASLGRSVLRVETAAVAVVASLVGLLG